MKTITVPQPIPFGLSRWIERPAQYSQSQPPTPAETRTGYQLRFPVVLCHRSGWDVFTDSDTPGWWMFNVLIKAGSVRCGWSLVKQTGPAMPCRQTEGLA